jgi:hypothetical protein
MPNAKPPEQLEAYLREIRANLRGLPAAEISEIVQELQSHVLDSVADDPSDANVRATLAKLGDPREVARINLSMRLAANAAGKSSPLTVARTIARLAGLSARGLFTLLISLLGYGFAACWLLVAVSKPFAPGRVGLWQIRDATGDMTYSLGRHAIGANVAGHEILGWWIIPVGLAIGMATAYLTYRFDLRAIRKMARPGERVVAE